MVKCIAVFVYVGVLCTLLPLAPGPECHAGTLLTTDEQAQVRGGCKGNCAFGLSCGVDQGHCGSTCPNGVSDCNSSMKTKELDTDWCEEHTWGFDCTRNLEHFGACGFVYDCYCDGQGSNAFCRPDTSHSSPQVYYYFCGIAMNDDPPDYVRLYAMNY